MCTLRPQWHEPACYVVVSTTQLTPGGAKAQPASKGPFGTPIAGLRAGLAAGTVTLPGPPLGDVPIRPGPLGGHKSSHLTARSRATVHTARAFGIRRGSGLSGDLDGAGS
jgi:hypothetical protein